MLSWKEEIFSSIWMSICSTLLMHSVVSEFCIWINADWDNSSTVNSKHARARACWVVLISGIALIIVGLYYWANHQENGDVIDSPGQDLAMLCLIASLRWAEKHVRIFLVVVFLFRILVRTWTVIPLGKIRFSKL